MRFATGDSFTRWAAADGGTATSLGHPDRAYTAAGRAAFLAGFESPVDVPCRVCGVHPGIPADLALGAFLDRVAQVKRRHFRRLRLGWQAKDAKTGTRPRRDRARLTDSPPAKRAGPP